MKKALLACALVVTTGFSTAQDFPNRPIRIIVPSSPGGSVDRLTRAIGQELQTRVGQPVIIENKPGAGGTIGAEATAAAAPDGYTLMMGTVASLATNTTMEKLRYDPIRDFTAVTLAGKQDMVLVVPDSSPFKTVQDLIRAAKESSKPFTYPSAGSGSGSHLSGAMFVQMAGIPALHVPYKGAAAAMNDLIASRHAFSFSSVATSQAPMDGKRIRALGTSGTTRVAILPNVPTLRESGLRDYVVTSWYGLVAPAKTPPAVIEKLNAHLVQILKNPKLAEMFLEDGMELVPTTALEFGNYMKAEVTMWAKVIKDAGLEAK